MAPMAKRKCTSSHRIHATSLEPESFKPFGQVVQNPASHRGVPNLDTVEANQGSATKWLDVTDLRSFYELARSGKAAKAVVNMFVCRPRKLEGDLFNVKILERHPFTPQTFIPMGLGKEDASTYYLVIVAPTLPVVSIATKDELRNRDPPYPLLPPTRKKSLRERLLGGRPNPFTNDFKPSTTPNKVTESSTKPKGAGGPDLDNIKAFKARGDQGVTYGPGTWHAPMVVLGEKAVDFVVVQYASGVGQEDCQEVEIEVEAGHTGIDVMMDRGPKAKL